MLRKNNYFVIDTVSNYYTNLVHHVKRFRQEATIELITLVDMFLVFGQFVLLQVSLVRTFEIAQLTREWFIGDVTIPHMTGKSGRRRTSHVAQRAFIAIHMNVHMTGE